MSIRTRRASMSLVVLMTAALTVPLATAAQAGGGCHNPATESSDRVVTLVDACFDATVTRVPVGAKVTWMNKDSIPHVVVGQGYRWGEPGRPAPR
ncbi:MAG: hypothetical protein ABR518_10240 [Actinomycetota bacterium]